MHHRPLRLTLLATAVAGVFHSHANAQASPSVAPVPPATVLAPATSPPAPVQKVEVKAAAESYNARRDDTATKIVVSSEEITRYGDSNVLDVFKRLPGLTVTGNGGRGGTVRMRGLGVGYTQILVDGDRPPVGFSLDDLAPSMIERIEIVRAATAEFSTQSIAGTINIVLKRAIRNAQRELKVGAGREQGGGSVVDTSLQLSDKRGKLGYSVSLSAVRASFRSSADDLTVEETINLAGQPLRRTEEFDRFIFEYRNVTLSPRLRRRERSMATSGARSSWGRTGAGPACRSMMAAPIHGAWNWNGSSR